MSGLVVGRVFDLNESNRRPRDLSLIVSGSSKVGTTSLRPFSTRVESRSRCEADGGKTRRVFSFSSTGCPKT